MRLIGDIGGTNARFALADASGNISEVKNYFKKDFYSFIDAINNYKSSVEADVTEVVLAVNAPIVNGKPHINTNNWGYESESPEKALRVKEVVFFNDLQAHAMSLPFLKEEDKLKINGFEPEKSGPIAVVGPGTGLGLAYGIYNDDQKKHCFHASEGGNQTAAAVGGEQLEVIAKVHDLLPSVRWEDLSSGRGIKAIYMALYGEEKTTEDIMKDLSEGSEKAEQVFRLFCDFLGGFVHNVATTFLPSGGIYIIGGILNRKENAEFLVQKTKFMSYYNSPEFYGTSYLSEYPIYLVTHFNPALLGLANFNAC